MLAGGHFLVGQTLPESGLLESFYEDKMLSIFSDLFLYFAVAHPLSLTCPDLKFTVTARLSFFPTLYHVNMLRIICIIYPLEKFKYFIPLAFTFSNLFQPLCPVLPQTPHPRVHVQSLVRKITTTATFSFSLR
jgi:hypothetical protein